jgi:DNA replication and repair protein RecF
MRLFPGVHLEHLRLRDFRNYAKLDVDFSPGFHLLLGRNAQGKTNILEAVYLLATLRSFRGVGSAQMVRHGQKGYFIGAGVTSAGHHNVRIYWSPQERNLTLDSQPVRRLSDYLGILRAVVFCTEDVLLVKGPASRRRRYLDLLLSQTQPAYLSVLQRYAQAVRSRNALLKTRVLNEAAMESFTREMVRLGSSIFASRHRLIPEIAPLVADAYRRIAHDHEQLQLAYQPSVKSDFAVELTQARSRERALRTTVVGPHRDEVLLAIGERPAAQFASEGQKRSIAIALKLAQAEFLATHHGPPPVLLIDDVMGELDRQRRAAFLPLLRRAQHARSQVFMTSTEENWPRELSADLTRWEVNAGQIARLTP